MRTVYKRKMLRKRLAAGLLSAILAVAPIGQVMAEEDLVLNAPVAETAEYVEEQGMVPETVADNTAAPESQTQNLPDQAVQEAVPETSAIPATPDIIPEKSAALSMRKSP